MTNNKPQKYFWDIESYDNLFCVGLLNDDDFLEMHYLVETREAMLEVQRACDDSGYNYKMYNLASDATRLLKHFKRQIPSMGKDSLLAQFLGLDEEAVQPKVDVYYSYNGLSYDIQMIDYFDKTVVAGQHQRNFACTRTN